MTATLNNNLETWTDESGLWHEFDSESGTEEISDPQTGELIDTISHYDDQDDDQNDDREEDERGDERDDQEESEDGEEETEEEPGDKEDKGPEGEDTAEDEELGETGEMGEAAEGAEVAEGAEAVEAAEGAEAAATAAEGAAAAAEGTEAATAAAATSEVWGPIAIGCAIIALIILVIVIFVIAFMSATPDKSEAKCTDNGSTTIVIDPGHWSDSTVDLKGDPTAWGNTGAEGFGVKERDEAVKFAKSLGPKLEAKGYKVVYTKDINAANAGDIKVGNKKRAEIANQANAALMIRLHDDGTSVPKTGGYYIIYPDVTGQVNYPAQKGGVKGPSADVQAQSKRAAELINGALSGPMTKLGMGPSQTYSAYTTGIVPESKTGGNADNGGLFIGSIFSKVPVNVVEVGNLSYSGDAKWLKSQSNIEGYTDALAKGIEAFAPVTSGSSKKSSAFMFPLKGTEKPYSGDTAGTAPSTPGAYVPASTANSFYNWPTPKPTHPYDKFKGQATVSPNQEPGYYACRPTSTPQNGFPALPNGCGRPHKGLDIYAGYGTPIVAPEDGVITSYGGADVFLPAGQESKNGGTGRHFTLDGASGYSYTFMHTMGFSEDTAKTAGVKKDFGNMADTGIKVPVKAGDVIGYVGRTGGIRNPHLHFRVTKGGKDVDPNDLIDSKTTGTTGDCNTQISGSDGEKAVQIAKLAKDTAYVFGGDGNGNGGNWKAAPIDPPSKVKSYHFDCSGLVGWAWYWATGGKVNLTHQSGVQFNETKRITRAELQPGDLIFFGSPIHHVAMYIGSNQYIEAPFTGANVRITNWKRTDMAGYGRPIPK